MVVPEILDDYFTRLSLQFEVSNDAQLMTRSVYTFWQVLSDVGGVNGLLVSFVALIVSITSYQQDENFLASHLYKPQSKNGR